MKESLSGKFLLVASVAWKMLFISPTTSRPRFSFFDSVLLSSHCESVEGMEIGKSVVKLIYMCLSMQNCGRGPSIGDSDRCCHSARTGPPQASGHRLRFPNRTSIPRARTPIPESDLRISGPNFDFIKPEFGLTTPVPLGHLTRAGYCATCVSTHFLMSFFSRFLIVLR
jgi:hypothetical protein